MLKELSEIAPTSVLLAVLLWAGLSYFITAPEISERVAVFDHIPACKESIAVAAANQERQMLSQYDGNDAGRQQAAQQLGNFNQLLNNPLGDRNYGNFINKYGTNPLDALTGGAISRAQNNLQSTLNAQRKAAEEAARNYREKILSTADDQCSCRAKMAFLENQSDWALFTGTFGLIKPNGVENFGANMAIQANTCAQRVG